MTPAEWTVLAPLISLAAGAVACVLLAAFRPGGQATAFTALLSLAFAFYFQGFVWQSDLRLGFNGLYEISPFTTLLGYLFLILAVLAWGFSSHFLEKEEPRGEFYALMLVSVLGMFLLVGANHLLFLFLGLEILSIPLYLLCAFRRDREESVEGGLKYFLLGTFAAAFLLFGAALIFAATGSLQIDIIEQKMRTLDGAATVLYQSGLALLLVGLLFKASLAPFHFWTPDVYEGAPTPVTALMSGGTKAAAFGALVSVLVLFPEATRAWFIIASILTLFVGNLGAFVQTNIKRMLAYSGIAHAGILLMALTTYWQTMILGEVIIFYLVAYGFTAVAAFGLIALLERDEGEAMTTVEGFRGLHHRRPWVAFGMTILLLSLGGIPPTAGFLAKYMVFAAVIEAGWVTFAIIGILFSVVSLAYYLRIVVNMYMMPSDALAPAGSRPSPLLPGLVSGLALAGVLAFGMVPGILLDLF